MHTSSLAIDFQQGLSDAWSSVAQFVPKFVGFLAILVIGWFVAKIVARLVSRILNRLGFDRLVERGGIKEMLARGRYDATTLIAKLAYYAVLLITLQLGFGIFGPNPVSTMLNGIVAWLPRLAVAIVIVCIAGAIAKVVMDMIANMLSGLEYGRMLGRVAAVFIWGIGIIAALNQIGVGTSVTMPILITVLATIAGVLIIGIGGGLIRPMQQRWEGWLDTIEGEMPEVKGHAQAYQRGREDAARQRAMMQQQMMAQQNMPSGQYPMPGRQNPPGKWADQPVTATQGYAQQPYGRQPGYTTGQMPVQPQPGMPPQPGMQSQPGTQSPPPDHDPRDRGDRPGMI